MNNNKIGSIAIRTASRPRARFNLAHDVNTTSAFGDIQPLMCRMIPANSKTVLDIESLVRTSPLLSPTFGRIKYKQMHHFVAMSDLTRNFSALMADQQVSRSSGTFLPTDVPSVTLGTLSLFVLAGAKCTLYDCSGDDSNVQLTADLYQIANINSLPSRVTSILSSTSFSGAYNPTGSFPLFDNYSGPTFNFRLCVDDQGSGTSNPVVLPIANQINWSFFDVLPSALNTEPLRQFSGDVTTVPLDSADYLITHKNSSSSSYTFAFRLSSFGKRLRKILLGCGYQIDFRSSQRVSLLPLFAFYKAYFDSFGLTLYNKWETTAVYQLLQVMDNFNYVDLERYFYSTNPESSHYGKFLSFINDLGNCWYTDSQDFVSAHISSTGVSNGGSALADFGTGINQLHLAISEPYSAVPNIATGQSVSMPSSPSAANSQPYINNLNHSQLDAEYLKILYKWTNRNTIAGQRIAELLRAQGLGKYVDECKSNFIGANECIVTISDVTSTSDTYQNNGGAKSGQVLGDYAGKAVEYNRSKTLSFENDEVGFWVTLACIVPESGYCQALDKAVSCLKKLDFYNPDFDGLGYEVSKKNNIVGAQDWSGADSSTDKQLTDPFGFVPQYTGLKIANNVMNGDFSLRGTKEGYQPFTLDKLVNIGERNVFHDAALDGTDHVGYRVYKLLTSVDLPYAGNVWRFVGRYPWLGLYNRIFNQQGTRLESDPTYYWRDQQGYSRYAYLANDYDNFLIHNILNLQMYAQMLPIEKSFETYDEKDGGSPNSSMGKA